MGYQQSAEGLPLDKDNTMGYYDGMKTTQGRPAATGNKGASVEKMTVTRREDGTPILIDCGGHEHEIEDCAELRFSEAAIARRNKQ